MISPKTALASVLLEASSSVGACVEDFVGEPDPSHSGLIAFELRFEAVLFFTVLDLETLVFLTLPFEALFSLRCSVGAVCTHRCPCSFCASFGVATPES